MLIIAARRGVLLLTSALVLALLVAAQAQAQTSTRVLVYTGTTGFRHTDAINNGIGPIRNALDAAGIQHDWEDCNRNGGAVGNCDHPDKNPRIFTPENLARYDAIFLFNASSQFLGGGLPGPLWNDAQRNAIRGFVNAGGGIAANHNAVDMGAGVTTWDWWDGGPGSAVGTLMRGHAATNINNVATVQVADRHHPSTRDLPDTYGFGDEHYNFTTNVRGSAHVLATLDEETYNPGSNRMGQDHPISWCKPYDGGRIWVTGMGHFGASYTENGGDNNLVKHLVGGIRSAAGETKDDCGATIWSNFERTVLSDDTAVGPIGLDVAPDGKVYWTEIGPVGLESSGRVKMYDPTTEEIVTVATIETRADHGALSEDGVLGMALEPGFDGRSRRHMYIYYSPRQAGPSGSTGLVVGHNRVSRFTLHPNGRSFQPDSERTVIDVPKNKVGQNGDGIAGQPSSNHPGHVGGGGLAFDSDGSMYLGVGDDVNPFGEGQSGYAPLDQRYPQRYDARTTAANTNDLRGKVLRIKPRRSIDEDRPPGVGRSYDIPAGNLFASGTPRTRPEIFAMGFRNPFSVRTDPAHPGTAVVGDYGPDAGTDNPTRGPAGIIEWNHVTRPGFYGWPFCTGDNSVANTYFRFTFPAGPAGAQFDCSAASIPNESPNNTGLPNVPGPAIAADVWHKKTGQHPARFGLPTQGSPQEPIAGPVYRFDPDLKSDTKWPEYYDGSWLILDRSQNWWREVRLREDNNDVLRVNGFFQPDQFGEPFHRFVIPLKFGPDGSLYLALWTGGCCRGLEGRPAQLMRIDYKGREAGG